MPPHTRLGVMQFSTNQHIEFHLSDWSTDDWQSQVLAMQQLGGQTWTKNAMHYAMEKMWTYSDDSKTKLSVIFTDGQPTTAEQSPCTIYDEYIDQDIL